MKAIVAVDKNWSIGKDGKLLARIPADQKFFRSMTTGGILIMGRKTLESFPNGQPLPKRINIVLTRDPSYEAEGCTVVRSIDEACAEAEKAAAAHPENRGVFVIGGGEIYREMLPFCDTAYVTKIDYAYDADTQFPNLDEDPEWEAAETSEEQTYFDLVYEFVTYRRTAGGQKGVLCTTGTTRKRSVSAQEL